MPNTRCLCCNQPLHIYTQPALLPGRPDRQLAECRTNGCERAWITMTPAELQALTPEAVSRYAVLGVGNA
jgi:hypothetical protein